MNSMNTYTLLINDNFTNQIHEFTVQNISNNDLFYEFDVNELFKKLPAGEYNYYLFWNTYTDYKIEFSSDILDSKITANNQTFTLRDVKPETGILKILDEEIKQPTYIDSQKNYLAYGK